MRRFGHIPGFPPGSLFDSRLELGEVKIHPPLQSGISGSKNDGADSIVLSGGYEDDIDNGYKILYTGQGGRDAVSGKQIGNQYLTRQNMALAVSCKEAKPVRVTRGLDIDQNGVPTSDMNTLACSR